MTDATANMPPTETTPGAQFFYRFLHFALVAIFGLFAYTQATTAYTATQKAYVLKAEADNADLRQGGEAALKEQEAEIALQTARNAAQRAKGEADMAEAEASKIAAEARTARAQAANQEDKARELTATTLAEVQLQKAKIIGKTAELRNLAIKARAEVEKAETDNRNAECQLRFVIPIRRDGISMFDLMRKMGQPMNCPKR